MELLIVNPKKRKAKPTKKGVKKMARKRRTAAQKAATKKLIAYNKRRGKKSTPKRRSRGTTVTVKTNPSRRRRFPKRLPAQRARRRARTGGGMLNTLFIPAATQAGGALALDVAMGYLPIPENIKTGPMRYFVKAGVAVGLGMIAEKVGSKKLGRNIATGALTVAMHGVARETIQKQMPQIQLGEMDADIDLMGMGAYMDDGMGAYMDDGMGAYLEDGMGAYPSSAPVFDDGMGGYNAGGSITSNIDESW